MEDHGTFQVARNKWGWCGVEHRGGETGVDTAAAVS
jgi:hypothetical protein